MSSKGSNEGCGCLAIIGLVLGFFFVKNVFWPWFTANKAAIGTWVGVILVGGIALSCAVWAFVFVKNSWKARRSFYKDCGAWLKQAAANLDEAERFANDDARLAKNLGDRITKLENAVRGIH